MSDTPEGKLLLEIVTPKGRALSELVDEVTAPAQGGELGVLPGHLPTLASLRTGLVSYRKGSDNSKCAVGAGFVEVGPNKVLILTDDYILRGAIDPVAVRIELADTQTAISKLELAGGESGGVSAQLNVLISNENWFAAQLELYGDPPPPTMRPYEEYEHATVASPDAPSER